MLLKNRKTLARLTMMIGLVATIVIQGQSGVSETAGVCFGGFTISSARLSAASQDPVDKRRARIVEIMQRTLKAGEGRIVHNGRVINTYTRRGPSREDVEEIRGYGDDAVPILADYLSSTKAPEYELAMKFLGAIGGNSIVPPLKGVIFQDQSARKREYAVRTITQAPSDEALAVLCAAASDHDARVRKVAKAMLKAMRP